MYWGGITQSLMWKEFTPEGTLRYPDPLAPPTEPRYLVLPDADVELWAVPPALPISWRSASMASAPCRVTSRPSRIVTRELSLDWRVIERTVSNRRLSSPSALSPSSSSLPKPRYIAAVSLSALLLAEREAA